jgi:hypothetical protein
MKIPLDYSWTICRHIGDAVGEVSSWKLPLDALSLLGHDDDQLIDRTLPGRRWELRFPLMDIHHYSVLQGCMGSKGVHP